MDKKEKDMTVGAFGTAITDLSLEALYWTDPDKWSATFPFKPWSAPHHWISPADDWIVGAGIPLGLYALGTLLKRQAWKERGKGAAIYGASMLGHHMVARYLAYNVPKTGQFNIDYDFPTTNIIRQAKAAATQPQPTTHRGEFLPFQQDMGY